MIVGGDFDVAGLGSLSGLDGSCGGDGQYPCPPSVCEPGYVPLQAGWLCPNLQSGSALGKCVKVDAPFMCADGKAYAVRSNGYIACVNGVWDGVQNTCVVPAGETGCGGVGQPPCATGCSPGYVTLLADWLCPTLPSGSAKGKCAKVDAPFTCADGKAYAVRSNGYINCVNGVWNQAQNTCVVPADSESIALPFVQVGTVNVDLNLGCLLSDVGAGVQVSLYEAGTQHIVSVPWNGWDIWHVMLGAPLNRSVAISELVGFVRAAGGPIKGSLKNYNAFYGPLPPAQGSLDTPRLKRQQTTWSANNVTSYAVPGHDVNVDPWAVGDLLVAVVFHNAQNPNINSAPPGWNHLVATTPTPPAGQPSGGSLAYQLNGDGSLGAHVHLLGGYDYGTALSVWWKVATYGDSGNATYTWTWQTPTRMTARLMRYAGIENIWSYAIELHNPYEKSFPASGGGSLPGFRMAPVVGDLVFSNFYVSGGETYADPAVEQSGVVSAGGNDFKLTASLRLPQYDYYLFATRIGFQAMACQTCTTCPPACPTGQAWDKIEGTCFDLPYCPTGYLWDPSLRACVTCPSGQAWDPAAKRCVTVYSPPPSCPSGQAWNPATSACVPIYPAPPTCPSGQDWNTVTRVCEPVYPPPPTCPAGQVWNTVTKTCVTAYPPPPSCPSGQAWNPATGACVPIYPAPPTCPTGQDWNTVTKVCEPVYAAPPTCPPGYLWDTVGKACVARVTLPSCPPDQLWDTQNQACIHKTELPSCPSGQVWDTQVGDCIPEVVLPTCPGNQLWDPKTGTCSSSKLWFWGMLGSTTIVVGVMALAAVWRGQ